MIWCCPRCGADLQTQWRGTIKVAACGACQGPWLATTGSPSRERSPSAVADLDFDDDDLTWPRGRRGDEDLGPRVGDHSRRRPPSWPQGDERFD